jgi:hypothetical protein
MVIAIQAAEATVDAARNMLVPAGNAHQRAIG